ncbi:hypothetical protein ACWG8W_06230 [Citricoccus zhacaiensis]
MTAPTTTNNTTMTMTDLPTITGNQKILRQYINEYHYLTVSRPQHEALQAEADRRGVAMAALVKAALDGEPLNLDNPAGVINVSLGIRACAADIRNYEQAAKKAKLKRTDWERSQLFSPGVIKPDRRRLKNREPEAFDA